MPTALSADAYPNVRAILDRAIAEEKGLTLTFQSEKAALAFRFRCYTVRDRERRRSRRIYPENSPMYDKSAWDKLSIIKEGSRLILTHSLDLPGVLVESLQ